MKEHEASGDSVPSSFKEFAEANLNSSWAAALISAISVFNNTCVLAFGVTKAGTILASLGAGGDSMALANAYSLGLVALLAFFSREQMSGVASVAVMALFGSFAGLLLPGLESIHDPMAAFVAPGTANDALAAAQQTLPILLTTMVFQNIVPTVQNTGL